MRHSYYMFTAILFGLLLSASNIQAQLRIDTLMHGGLEREYRTFLPQGLMDNMPLVLIFHGSWPEEGEWTINYTQMNSIADTAGFIAVYPQSLPDRWHAGGGVSPEPNVDDLGFVQVLIDTLADRYSIDRARVYMCGLNYGGGMVIQCALQIADRFAAGAIVNAFLTQQQVDDRNLSRPFPWLMCMGTAHSAYNGFPPVLWGAEESLAWWLTLNGCTLPGDTVRIPDLDPTDGCTVEKIAFGNDSASTRVVYYKVLDGGMAWPGSFGSYAWEGNKNMDINAGAEIWEFFKDIVNPFVTSSHISDKSKPPLSFGLRQNFPNPFNPATTIEYQLPSQSYVSLRVFDMLGQEIAVLVDEVQSGGYKTVEFEASGLPSGVYLYRLTAGDFVATKKLVLLR